MRHGFGGYDTAVVVAERVRQVRPRLRLLLVFPLQQRVNQCHTHILAVLHLAEISGTRVVVHVHGYLVHAGQRVQHNHIRFGKCHLRCIKNKRVFEPLILVLVCKTLLLHARHIEYVHHRHRLLQGLHLGVVVAEFLLHIVGQAQFGGRNQYKMRTLVAAHCLDERMDGASVFQVAAQTDSQVVEASEFAAYCQQVGHSLRRVAVSAIARIDDGNAAVLACHTWGTLFVVAHGDDVGKRRDDAHRIGYRLALAHRTRPGVGEAQHVAAEFHHSGCKTQSGTGTRLIEKRCQLLAAASVSVLGGVGNDVQRTIDNAINLRCGQIGRV